MATILIVEDGRKTNEAICEYLKPAGHTLIPAYDGEEAFRLFSVNSIDLVVLDIMLPKISGMSVLQKIRDESAVPVPDAHRHRGRAYPSEKLRPAGR